MLDLLIVIGLIAVGFHFIGKQDWKHAIIGSFVFTIVLFVAIAWGMVLVQHREVAYR